MKFNFSALRQKSNKTKNSIIKSALGNFINLFTRQALELKKHCFVLQIAAPFTCFRARFVPPPLCSFMLLSLSYSRSMADKHFFFFGRKHLFILVQRRKNYEINHEFMVSVRHKCVSTTNTVGLNESCMWPVQRFGI